MPKEKSINLNHKHFKTPKNLKPSGKTFDQVDSILKSYSNYQVQARRQNKKTAYVSTFQKNKLKDTISCFVFPLERGAILATQPNGEKGEA